MQKTLGGDRLGSGKKMKVDLHGYERSTHDLSYVWRSTMSAGTLVPFMCEVALPGDTFDINLDCDIKTHPTIGPLFGSYKVQLDTFLCPIRLYNSLLHNNMLGIGMNMAQVKLPIITLTTKGSDSTDYGSIDIDNSQINPSCLLSYLGIRGIGINTEDGVDRSRDFNAIPILAYWEIYKNYYANKMEPNGYAIHTPAQTIITTVDDIKIFRATLATEVTLPESPTSGAITIVTGDQIRLYYTGTVPNPEQIIISTTTQGDLSAQELGALGTWNTATGYIWAPFRGTYWGTLTLTTWRYKDSTDINTGKPSIAPFDLINIDTMRTQILQWAFTTPFNIDGTPLPPYEWLAERVADIPNSLSSQEGLGLKTYQSDLFNNWLNTEIIDGPGGITEVTAIDTSGGSFTLDTLNLSKKVYEMLNRIAVSGGTYDDWLDAVYTHDRYTRCETPMYMGGLIKELVFQEVVSNSEAADGTPLGTLAGKGVMSNKHKGGNIIIKVDEPSYIMGIISLTPRIDYSQGNKWDTSLQTLDDLHKPQLDEIGFQELMCEQMAWWDVKWNGTDWVKNSAGKQPAWINYMTNVNRTYGNFAIGTSTKVGEMFMTLNRRYEYDNAGAGIHDLTTYIDPSKFNFIFAETALDAQNFWSQIAVNITARRKMSAKIMPNL